MIIEKQKLIPKLFDQKNKFELKLSRRRGDYAKALAAGDEYEAENILFEVRAIEKHLDRLSKHIWY